MADYMENKNGNKKTDTGFHFFAQLAKPYFSYKKPGGEGTFAYVNPQIHRGNLTLKFVSSITSENKTELSCYIPFSKMIDFANILEGIMGRRREAFSSNRSYDADEAFDIPISSYLDGSEKPLGLLRIDTEMIDGVPRLRLTYTQFDVNKSVSIVFAERPRIENVTGTKPVYPIDYIDIGAYGFTILLKEIQEPSTMMFYHMIDSAANYVIKSLSGLIGSRGNSGFFANKRNKYNNSVQQSNIIDGSDYEVF